VLAVKTLHVLIAQRQLNLALAAITALLT
jgi:hypothetical protein